MKIAAMYCDHQVGSISDASSIERRFVLPEKKSGKYPVYKKVKSARKTEHKLEPLPGSLEEVFELWSKGHPVRMYAFVDGKRDGGNVLWPSHNSLIVEYETL